MSRGSTDFALSVICNRSLGLTVLLVEQNPNLALEVSHYGQVLETGRTILQYQLNGPHEELMALIYAAPELHILPLNPGDELVWPKLRSASVCLRSASLSALRVNSRRAAAISDSERSIARRTSRSCGLNFLRTSSFNARFWNCETISTKASPFAAPNKSRSR